MLPLIGFPLRFLFLQVELIIFTQGGIPPEAVDRVVFGTVDQLATGYLIVKLSTHHCLLGFEIDGPSLLLNEEAISASNNQNLVALWTYVRPTEGTYFRTSINFYGFPLVTKWLISLTSRHGHLWMMSFFSLTSTRNTSVNIYKIINNRECKVRPGRRHVIKHVPSHISLALWIHGYLGLWIKKKLDIITDTRSGSVTLGEVVSNLATDNKKSMLPFLVFYYASLVHESCLGKKFSLVRMA